MSPNHRAHIYTHFFPFQPPCLLDRLYDRFLPILFIMEEFICIANVLGSFCLFVHISHFIRFVFLSFRLFFPSVVVSVHGGRCCSLVRVSVLFLRTRLRFKWKKNPIEIIRIVYQKRIGKMTKAKVHKVIKVSLSVSVSI